MGKRLLVTILILAMALMASSGCAKVDSPNEESDSQPQTIVESDSQQDDEPIDEAAFAFTYKGKAIVLNEEAPPLIASLGTPNDVFTAPSCAFPGEDHIYYYPGLAINTYPETDDNERILSFTLQDDTVETDEGVYIGMNEAEVVAIYGNGEKSEDGSIVSYYDGDEELRIFFESGKATDITFFYMPAQGQIDAHTPA